MGMLINKAVYLALGVNMDGDKEVLGMWVAENEGAKFWLQVVTELQNRGIEDIFIDAANHEKETFVSSKKSLIKDL